MATDSIRVLCVVILGSVLLLAFADPAAARCHVEWDCSGGYPCRQVQICDNSIDLPSIPPPGISPIPPPSIRPIPQPVVPPVGTTQCQPTYLCDNFGRCAWRTTCQ